MFLRVHTSVVLFTRKVIHFKKSIYNTSQLHIDFKTNSFVDYEKARFQFSK
jgi:hypothetical protein